MLPRTPSKGLRKLRLHLCHSLSSLLLFVIMILPSGSVGKSPKQILLGTKYSDTSSLNEDKRWEKASSASYIHNHVKHRTTPYWYRRKTGEQEAPVVLLDWNLECNDPLQASTFEDSVQFFYAGQYTILQDINLIWGTYPKC